MWAMTAAAALVLAAADTEPQYVSRSGQKHFAQPDAQGQVMEAEKKLAAEPGNVALMIALGDAHAGIWDLKGAIQVYDRALALAPGNATLYQQRGHRYLSLRRHDRARADLEKAVGMDPKLAGAWYYLGVLNYLQGRFDDAAAAFEENLALQGGDVTRGIGTVDWLYSSYRRGKKDDKARPLLARVTPDLKIEGNPRLYFHRILFYKGARTEDELLASATSDVERATLLYGIGNVHLLAGDTAKARDRWQKVTAGTAWVALAFMAAEADLARLEPR